MDSPDPLRLARVSQEHRESFRVLLAPGEERLARVSGRLRREGPPPAVGDWVRVEIPPGDGDAVIREVLPRRGVLLRKEAGTTVGAQVLAAHVDVVLVAVPMDRGFRPGLADRALALAWDAGADPVVLLTKADLDPDPAARAREAALACPAAPVLAVSAATGAGLDALAPFLSPGRTAALLGPSGAGKSTLLNRLMGSEAMETGAVRDEDARGRHTTVHRHLHALPSGAFLVDTPGMREIALFGAEEGISEAFADVAALALSCRFRDCAHGAEPGCAVVGALDPARLESWRKLRREEAFLARKAGIAALWEEKARRRGFGRMVKEAKEAKRRSRDS